MAAPHNPRSPDRGASALERARAVAGAAQDRDPCTYCGVRGEIGCRHRRAA